MDHGVLRLGRPVHAVLDLRGRIGRRFCGFRGRRELRKLLRLRRIFAWLPHFPYSPISAVLEAMSIMEGRRRTGSCRDGISCSGCGMRA